MFARLRTILVGTLVGGGTLLLSACGQKGDLYLPAAAAPASARGTTGGAGATSAASAPTSPLPGAVPAAPTR